MLFLEDHRAGTMDAMTEPARPRSARSASLGAIFLTVFLDLLGFSMFIPDLQLRGESIAARELNLTREAAQASTMVGWMIGGLLAAYSLCQLLAAPILGRWSDRIGRRKILLATTALSIGSYLIYGFAQSFNEIIVARALAGLAAANLGVAFAYAADVTTPENRSKGIGLVGAALGLGFILGPVIGGQILKWSGDSALVLATVAASLAAINFVYILVSLPESVKPGETTERQGFFREFAVAVAIPDVRRLMIMFFGYNMAFAMLQATFFRLIADQRWMFNLSDKAAKETGSYILAAVGVSAAVIQGGLLGRLQSRFGDLKLLRFGLILLLPGLALVPYSPLWVPILIVAAMQGVGSGLAAPTINSLISQFAPREIQGGVFGITQSLGALARLTAPLLANPLFAIRPDSPYWLGAIFLAVPAILAFAVRMPERATPAKLPA